MHCCLVTCRSLALVFCVYFLLVSSPGSAFADSRSFSGTYSLSDEESDDIATAYEAAVRDLPLLIRPFARLRVRNGMKLARVLRVQIDGDSITVQTGDRPPVIAPLNGKEVQVRGDFGRTLRLSIQIDADGVLCSRLVGERGVFLNDYELSPDGSLLFVSATTSFDWADSPVRYRLVYLRQ